MNINFKDTFISSIIIGIISLLTFFIGLNFYNSSSEKTKNKSIDDSLSIINKNKEIEYLKLKEEIEYLKNRDSIDETKELIKKKEQLMMLNNEIISYSAKIQKYLISSKNINRKALMNYRKRLVNYYRIKGLSNDANRLLISTIKMVDNEILLIDKKKSSKKITKIEKNNKPIIDDKKNKQKNDTINGKLKAKKNATSTESDTTNKVENPIKNYTDSLEVRKDIIK